MRDLTVKFGENAGKIWSALYEKKQLKFDEITEITKLNKNDFYTGIGWLAREDKIKQENNNYKLDNTNLDSKVGTNAGRVWKIIDIWGEVDITTMKRLSYMEEDEIYSALGWLAREDKIGIKNNSTYYLK